MPNPRLLAVARSFLGIAALWLLVFPRPASAGSVTITLNNASFSVTEGSTITLDFTISNGSSTSISTGGYDSFPISSHLYAPTSGDMTDVNAFLGTFASPLSPCVGLASSDSLSPGSSCDESYSVSTLSGSGETDANFGVIPLQLQVSYLNCTDPSCVTVYEPPITSLSSPFEITVTDPPARATPEPASLLLFGTGLLALGPIVRRRIF